MRGRALALGAAATLLAVFGLAACGSSDNGGVITNPPATTAPGATTTAPSGTPSS